MPTLIQEVWKKKWLIFLFTLLTVLISFLYSWTSPKLYLAEASLLPANSRMMDRQRLFGEHIQELYSAYGGSDDLDRLFATMQSSSVMQYVSDSMKLVDYYKLSGKKNGRILARKKLEKNINLIRSEYGELRLRIWDKDTLMAEQIADALIAQTQSVFDDMFRLYYDRSIRNLRGELMGVSDVAMDSTNGKMNRTLAVLQSRIAEYEVTRLNPPPAFIIMEQPMASAIADKPRIAMDMIVAALFALFTSLALIVARLVVRQI